MKIYYIYHSGFIIETTNSFLIFDYYKSIDNTGDFEFKNLLNDIIESKKTVCIFASHSHMDHYNSEILAWGQNKDDTYYIFSNDIKVNQDIKNLNYIGENQELTLNDIKIKTFGSTDAGVSFLLNIDNINIFHAGDLNWWKWNDDTEAEEKEMEDAFKNIIKNIFLSNVHFNITFFPVDGRLEENYLCGGDYFIDTFKPDLFVPMHFGDNFETVTNFIKSQSHKNIHTEIMNITHANQLLLNK